MYVITKLIAGGFGFGTKEIEMRFRCGPVVGLLLLLNKIQTNEQLR